MEMAEAFLWGWAHFISIDSLFMYFVPANAIDQIRAATFRGPFKTLTNSVFMCSLASKVSDGLLEIKLLFISKMYFFVSKRIPLFSFFL